jgi:7-carboxy-7-deazaguanine synthase
MSERLKVTEVFCSIQGEARDAGWPSVFIRLTGCPLRCQYCDTAYAFHGGEWHELSELMDQVESFGVHHVCVTGGEPLAQRRCVELLTHLCDAGYAVSLETSGALDISVVDERVRRVLDIKTPGSSEVERNLWGNIEALTAHDAIKFVICSRDDYLWCCERVAEQLAQAPCPIFFSPSSEQQDAAVLAEWVIEDQLPVRMQIQMHKVLWGGAPGT